MSASIDSQVSARAVHDWRAYLASPSKIVSERIANCLVTGADKSMNVDCLRARHNGTKERKNMPADGQAIDGSYDLRDL